METPTINVNLKDCYSYCQAASYPPREHETHCPAYPVPIPLPLDNWRSVTFEVRLGECACPVSTWRKNAATRTAGSAHDTSCPARPIRVACTISGKTWEEGEVADAWPADGDGSGNLDGLDWPNELAACRARWALIKALVLGMPHHSFIDLMTGPLALELVTQRDAVYAALADMARAEDVQASAQTRCYEAMREQIKVGGRDHESQSSLMLDRYVGRLIEQVSVLEAP